MPFTFMASFAALIPCYNVGKACIQVILKSAQSVDLCIAVDDGSTDDTYSCMKTVSAPNLVVLRHEENLGKGAALLTGFRYLLGKKVEAIVTLDGDGQHDASLISRFTSEFDDSRAALICGNRMMDQGSMPLHRKWLNRLSNRIISRICRKEIHDSQCGFRLYSTALLEAIIDDLKTVRYELETEILIKACRLGMDVRFVPISTIYSRETTHLSHHNFYDVLRIARLLTTHYWKE